MTEMCAYVAGLAQKHSETISCIWLHLRVALQRNEMNFKKHEHFHLVPCVKRFKGIGRIGTSISLRQETEPALLMSKSELVIPSTPSFLVLNPKGIFESFLLSFRFFFALNKWEKVVKGILLLYTNSPGGHLKMCLNSRVFTTALWLLCHALWCQSPTPVLRSCLFKSCCVVS